MTQVSLHILAWEHLPGVWYAVGPKCTDYKGPLVMASTAHEAVYTAFRASWEAGPSLRPPSDGSDYAYHSIYLDDPEHKFVIVDTEME